MAKHLVVLSLARVRPKALFIGYNSKTKAVALPEPEKRGTWALIHRLEAAGIRVLKKEMRDGRVRKMACLDLFTVF